MKHLILSPVLVLLFFSSLSLQGQSESDLRNTQGLPVWVASPRSAAYPTWSVRAVGISGSFDAEDETAARSAAERNALGSLSLQLVAAVRAETVISSSHGSSEFHGDIVFSTLESTTESLVSRSRFLEYHTVFRYGKVRCYVLIGMGESDFQTVSAEATEEMLRYRNDQEDFRQHEEEARLLYNTLTARGARIPSVTGGYYAWTQSHLLTVRWGELIPVSIREELEEDWRALAGGEPTVLNYRERTIIHPSDVFSSVTGYIDGLPHLNQIVDGNDILVTAAVPAGQLVAAHSAYSARQAQLNGYTFQINYNGLEENQLFLEELTAIMGQTRYRLDERAENMIKITFSNRVYSPDDDYNMVEISARVRWEGRDGTVNRHTTSVYKEIYSDEANFQYQVEKILLSIAAELDENLDSLVE